MTNAEFSDTFTTLLNSYNTQSLFGEEASKREIVLDEYEKSVLLTQAQDIIVKSYFEGAGGQGFDDTARRQIDFNSLIKVVTLSPANSSTSKFDDRGIIYKLPRKVVNNVEIENTTDVLYILNEKLTAVPKPTGYYAATENTEGALVVIADDGTPQEGYSIRISDVVPYYGEYGPAVRDYVVYIESPISVKKDFVIVPINYREYDREMSKPYAQPLKKQAWRLFQNISTGFDTNSELIVKQGMTSTNTDFIYKIRYVKRPNPIVLENLPNGLTVDGISTETPCELNPILHMDILTKAVELAITTRGAAPAQPRQQQQQ